MASLESLLTRSYAAQSMSGRTVDDKSIALAIVHDSSVAVTSVTVVSGTGITLIDATGTSGSLAFNTYTTLGTLADKINSLSRWKCRILDGLRDTSTASSVLLPNSAITAVTVGNESVYQVFIDQSVNDSVFYRVAMDRGVLNTDTGVVKANAPALYKKSRRVKITGIKYKENISAATLNGLRIYEFDPVSLSETLIYTAKTVDDTETTLDFTLNPITSADGNEFIVMITDSAISDAITNFLQVDYIRE